MRKVAKTKHPRKHLSRTILPCLLLLANQSTAESLLIPAPTPSSSALVNSPRNIKDGLNIEDHDRLNTTTSPFLRENSKISGGVEIKAVSSDILVSDLKNFKIFTLKDIPTQSSKQAAIRHPKSLIAFYALKGSGDEVEVKFSSKLLTPGSSAVERTASVRVPADGQIRMVPLFFSLNIAPSTPPGEYRMHWSIEDPKTGGSATANASFKKVAVAESKSGSFGKIENQQTPQADSSKFNQNTQLKSPLIKEFDAFGEASVGLPDPLKKKRPSGFETPLSKKKKSE